MKKLGIFFTVLSVLALVSCATNPLPMKEGNDDCLVVIRTTYSNSTQMNASVGYQLELDHGYGLLNVSDDQEGFVMIRVHESGVKVVGLIRYVKGPGQLMEGAQEESLSLDLPYRPGEVVVADFTFARVLEKKNMRNLLSSYSFTKTSSDRKAVIIEKLRKMENAKSWFAE